MLDLQGGGKEAFKLLASEYFSLVLSLRNCLLPFQVKGPFPFLLPLARSNLEPATTPSFLSPIHSFTLGAHVPVCACLCVCVCVQV